MDVLPRVPAEPGPPATATGARPRLSVVIVNYRGWEDTARLVAQLRATPELRRGHAEVVVVDNHSPHHPLIRLLRRTSGVSLRRWRGNRGFARAVNEGCRLSRGEWVLLLNPDVTVPPDFLARALDCARRAAAEVGIVGLRLVNTDGSPQLSTGRFPTLTGTLARLLLPRAVRKYTRPAAPGPCPVDWVTGCCMLLRRECWQALGGLGRDYFLYYEDVDLCRRATSAGWGVCHDPGAWVVHHHPLHTRAVPAHLRLITRHALLTYASKHWPTWQARALGAVVRVESLARRLAAWWAGDDRRVRLFARLDYIVTDLQAGQTAAARARLRQVVREQEEILDARAVDRHPVAQPAGPAVDLPAFGVPTPAGGARALVVDDASEGEAVSVAARAFPGVEVLRLLRRGGFAAAANAGVAVATGEVVQLLNDDTEVSPGWAEPALAPFAAAEVAAVTPLVLIGPPGDGAPVVDSTGDGYFIGGVASKRGHREPLAARHLVSGPVFGASGSGSFFRRSAYLAVGGMPVELGAYFDDVDLSFRLRRAGHSIVYEPASRIYHRVSSSYGPPNGWLLALQSRNEELVFWRNLPARELIAALPLHLAVLAGKAVRRLGEGQLLPFLAGRWAALVSVREVWRHRRRLALQWPGGDARLIGALSRRS